MARGGTESAYRGKPSPTTRDDVPGFVNRLLRKRLADRRSPVAAIEESQGNTPSENQHKPAVTLVPAAALHQQDTTASARQPEPAPATPTLGLKMPSATPQPQPQPQLKKKASFRDRLKTWQKPPPQPLEMVAEEPKPRFVYEPTHAAADFSRIAVSPSGPGWQGLASPMQPLTGGEGVPARRASQTRAGDGGRTRRDQKPTRQHRSNARSEAKRHSHTPRGDSSPAVNTTAHVVPTDTHPVNALRKTAQQAPQPLSDYELFIARAEADERQRRERMQQMLRSMSQRSAAAKVSPDPHRQFAAGGSSSAERSRHVSGRGGSSEQQQQKQRHETRRGHARHASWAPTSSTAGGSSSERAPPQRSQAQQQQQKQMTQTPPQAPPETIAYTGDEDVKNGHNYEYQPQPPRTLRRQASLTKRIVEYIRPSKAVMRTVETLAE